MRWAVLCALRRRQQLLPCVATVSGKAWQSTMVLRVCVHAGQQAAGAATRTNCQVDERRRRAGRHRQLAPQHATSEGRTRTLSLRGALCAYESSCHAWYEECPATHNSPRTPETTQRSERPGVPRSGLPRVMAADGGDYGTNGSSGSSGEQHRRQNPRKRIGRPPVLSTCQVCKISLQENRIFFRVS